MEKKAKRHQKRGPLDLLGQPSGKWDYKVYYTGTPYINISLEDIKPTGWGDDLEVDTRDDKKAKHDESYQHVKSDNLQEEVNHEGAHRGVHQDNPHEEATHDDSGVNQDKLNQHAQQAAPSKGKQLQEHEHDNKASSAQVNVITHSKLPQPSFHNSTSYLIEGGKNELQEEGHVENVIINSIANSLMKTPN